MQEFFQHVFRAIDDGIKVAAGVNGLGVGGSLLLLFTQYYSQLGIHIGFFLLGVLAALRRRLRGKGKGMGKAPFCLCINFNIEFGP